MFRQMLLAGASRMAFAPQTDNEGGADYEDDEELTGADADFDDADDGDEDGGEVDPADSDQDSGEYDGGAEGEVEDEPPPRQLSRAERRVQSALTAAKAAEDRAAKIEAELAALKAERTRSATAEQQAAERQRLEMMSPDERAEYRVSQIEKSLKAELEQTKFQIWDQADKASFDTLAAQRPQVAKAAAQVEAYLAQMRAAGTNAPRATVLRYVIGDMALAAEPRARGKAERQAETNRQRQTVAPPRTRNSDVGRGGRRTSANTPEGREARLADRLL
jgi:hypothetical protein